MSQDGFYHCAVKPVGRATGRSAVAAAAYRAGERLDDDRTGLTHDYRAKGGVVDAFIIAPKDAPDWATDRAKLWNACEAATTAKNGRLATELELALPHELTPEQRRNLAETFARDIAERYNVAVDVAIHGPGKGGDHRNHHAHMMITHRTLGPEGFGEISNARTIERKVKGQTKAVNIAGFTTAEDTTKLRAAWADALNAAYKAAGLDIHADHRSHKDRDFAEEPTRHLGPSASGMERRGEASERGDENRAIIARNEELAKNKMERLSVAAAIAEVVAERQERAYNAEMRAAVRSAAADRILEAMTERRATFTRADLVRALRKAEEDKTQAELLATELLAHPDVIGLRETADGAVTRYTTREVLAAERQILKDARRLSENSQSGLMDRRRYAAMKNHKHLDEEQRAAFDHATSNKGFTIVAGEAGSGKSTTLAAIRDAYEQSGYRVIGMAWTNSVVQDMKADGFRETSTVAAALGRIERAETDSGWHWKRNGTAAKNRTGKDLAAWDGKTVLILDEAAMLSSRHLGRVMEYARAAGAKVILAGDAQQLASIERGGMFGALEAEHGAAELHTVRRVKDQAQREAYNHMHAGRFGEALNIFDKAGAIKWTDTQDEARAALVGQWAADTLAAPDKSRFVFAYSNADVAALNIDLRAIRRERGQLGEDHLLNTRDGQTAFAQGDRVQFTGSAYYSATKAEGLVTGGMGTIRNIDGLRVTVELDARAGQKPRTVSFTVGEDEKAGEFNALRHGYAGTIYKGQGRTLDQSYLYHSESWKASAAYVALSRHRDTTSLFVAREVTSGKEPWMMQQGGLEALDERHRAQAEKSYRAWADEQPTAERFGIARYVAYVQGKQAERGRSDYDMAQLVRQISRQDETRAASQFYATDLPRQSGAGAAGQPRSTLSGPRRYEALKEAARAAAARVIDPLADLFKRNAIGRKPSPFGKYDDLPQRKEQPAPTAEAEPPKVEPIRSTDAKPEPAKPNSMADHLKRGASGRKPSPAGKYDDLPQHKEQPAPGKTEHGYPEKPTRPGGLLDDYVTDKARQDAEKARRDAASARERGRGRDL